MNRIETALKNLQKNNKKMLSPYITAGDPITPSTVKLMHALVESGANIIELGIPFSDPMAEGLVIQAAMERALQEGVNLSQVLEMVKEFREKDKDTPIVLMGYVNPIEHYGYERFAKKANEVGADATILVDLPPEESDTIKAIWEAYGLYSIYLCSPTTTPARMDLMKDFAHGYLYYVSLKGVTGSNDFDLDNVKTYYQERKQQSSLPIMVGFGIKTPEMAACVAEFADGIIVGAALISTLFEAEKTGQDAILAGATLIHDMRQAIDNGKKYD